MSQLVILNRRLKGENAFILFWGFKITIVLPPGASFLIIMIDNILLRIGIVHNFCVFKK